MVKVRKKVLKKKRKNTRLAIKKHNLFGTLKKRIQNSKGWNSAKKYSKIIEEKIISISKKVFFLSVKFGLILSDKAQCPDCKVVNEPKSHKWTDTTHGFNNIGKPAPDFAKRVNSYKCKHCKKEYTKKLLIKEAICPCCKSMDCELTSDGDKDYIDEDTAKYESQTINIGFLNDYPWAIKIVDFHQVFYCRKCDLNLWQYKTESRQNCCPYCHAVCKAEKNVYVTDVSTYSKSEIIGGEHKIVAYEHGYETTEYFCPECGEVVYKSGGWYDRSLP